MIANRGPNMWQMQSQLLVAIQYGDIERCAALLAAGADCDQVFKINSQSRPAICLGVERGAIKLVELLIRSGSAINRTDSNGCTSLHAAAEMGYLSISKLLIQNRANVNAGDNKGIAPLHIAAKRGCVPLVQCLLFHGAEINRKDHSGKTPLIYACGAPTINFDVVQLLLANGAEADEKDDAGFTPLLYTLLSPCYTYETVKTLVSLKASLNVFTPDGKAPIHLIVQSNNPEKWKCLSLLLKHGCDINLQNQIRQSPVHLACLLSDTESLRILIRAGADPNTSDILGTTPMSCAAAFGNTELVKLLLSGGGRADPEILKILNLSWVIPRLREPTSLMEYSRRSFAKYMGASTADWIENHRREIPATIIPFILLQSPDQRSQ